MNDTDITTISFNIIYRKYISILPKDKHNYYHIYEYLYNRAYEESRINKFTLELISYVELGIGENIFPKWEIIQMIKISPSFFQTHVLENSEKLKNNNLIKEIMQIFDYVDTTIYHSGIYFRNEILNHDYKDLKVENEKLKEEINFLRIQLETLQIDVFHLKTER